ncbi:proteinase-activated receptor 4 [Gasterosteus aculeatus]|uniref:G-protein coupled receptors family 1 profile domain-containing protein n=2 Tax=Gasterosteus aculeatus aculeatus TaxID=481459 RepID=A0AAQ4QK12_GASAC|nr:proteinase-activated receptor 4 [Gasterosteus aculeatus aculeatus]
MKLFGTLLFASVLLSICSVSQTSRAADNCSSMSFRLRAFRLQVRCNVTTLKEKQLEEIQAPTTNLYLPILYLLSFVVGLPSNLVALWVLVFRTKPLPSTTLLINLTAADCLLLLVLPFRMVYHFMGNHWNLGEPFCRVVMAIFYGNMYGSVLCLALVALDRYVALVHPFAARTLRGRRTSLCMTAAVWAVVLAAMLPLLISQQTYELEELQITTCHDALPEQEQDRFFLPYFCTLFTFCFLLPLLVVLYCHSAVLHSLLAEGKRYGHAVRVTVLMLLVFLVCLLPSNVLLLLTYADGKDGEDLYVPYTVSLAISTFNSCIDPFIFYFVSAEFREKARGALCCRGDAKDRRSHMANKVSYSSSSSSRLGTKVTILSRSSRSGLSQTT